jgi:regulatory protein YycI of two-component signal transduction system YycFG
VNLGRAKTALIYAFLGLNIFLSYHLLLPFMDRFNQVAVSSADYENARSYLEQNNYILEAEIIRSAQVSTFLTVAPAQQIRDELRSLFSGASVVSEENKTSVYRLTDRELTVRPEGPLRIDFKPGLFLEAQSETPEDQELSGLVLQLLGENMVVPDEVRYNYIKREQDGRKIIHYYQDIGGTPLYAGYMNVFIEGDRIVSVELYWLELIDWPQEGEIEVIPATEALIRLVEELGPSPNPRQIIKVDLGYYSREYNAEKWEIPPVWRILLGDGGVYYINAFTGNLEADE